MKVFSLSLALAVFLGSFTTTRQVQASSPVGDIDGDGKLTTNDTVIMRRHLAGHSKLSGAKLNAADVDLNGQVDQTDLELLRKAIAGSVKLPSVN